MICFLCHYMGHNLDDLACQNRKGELLTVRFACYRHALRYIEFVTIAQMQNVNNTTVWRRRKSIQKKYLRYVVMQG